MTLEVRQICNGCGTVRLLEKVPYDDDPSVDPDYIEEPSWVKVAPNVHLCATCISKAVTKPVA